MRRGSGCWVLDVLASSGPLSVLKIVGRVSGIVTSATLSATVSATSSTSDTLPSDGSIDIDRRTGGGDTNSGASARRCRSALTATSPSNCGLVTAGRLIPSVLGGIALRARNNSNADGAAMLGPPSPCGKRIDGRSGGSEAAACDRRAASGAVGGASVSSPMDPISGAMGGDSAGSAGVDFGTDDRRSLSADADSDGVGTGLALLARAEVRLAFAV